MTTEQDSLVEGIDATAVGDAEEVQDDAAVEKKATKHKGRLQRMISWLRARWLRLVLGMLVVGSAGLAAGLLYFQYWPDRQTDSAAGRAATTAASDGTVALLSYSPDTLDKAFTAAKAHLTGDFLTYYNDFTQQIVAPAAKQKGVKTTAAVVRKAVSELHRDSAVVLLFVNQSTTSTERPEPDMRASMVRVTLTKVNGAWLISKFDPV